MARAPSTPRIEQTWLEALQGEFDSDYMRELSGFLRARRADGATIFPPAAQIFRAFDSTPLPQVRVVIVGQDPYHGRGQACGLCFSVPQGTRIPPSLRNVFREIHDDLGIPEPSHGDLEHWARQGVLLLNATLTVEEGVAGAHQRRGWERFTDSVIRTIDREREGVVFLLWGRFAQAKAALVDGTRHHILTAAHPSPYSADSGFFGCRHFSRANELLLAQGDEAIDWSLPDQLDRDVK